MDEYAGRVLADRYRLPLPPADEYELAETRAFDTYSGQEVLVRQVPLPEVVDAEVLELDERDLPDGELPAGFVSAGAVRRPSARTTRRPSDPAVRRAIEAAQAAAQIPDHPRLDQVFDVFAEGGSLWIVSELVAARSLAALLADRPLSPYRAAEIASDVVTALRVLHAHGWVHRNITARTVLVCDDGRVVLTGLAAGAAEEALCGYDPRPEELLAGFDAGGGAGSGAGTDAGVAADSDVEAGFDSEAGIDADEADGAYAADGAYEVDEAGDARGHAAIEAAPHAEPGGDARVARPSAIAAYRAGTRAAARVSEEPGGGPGFGAGGDPAEGYDEDAPEGPGSGEPKAAGLILDPYGVSGKKQWHGAVPRGGGGTGLGGFSGAVPDQRGAAEPGSAVTGSAGTGSVGTGYDELGYDERRHEDQGLDSRGNGERGFDGGQGRGTGRTAPGPAATRGGGGPKAAPGGEGPGSTPAPSVTGHSYWDSLVAERSGARRGPATALAAERARHARMTVVGGVTERWAPEQAGPVHENWRLAPPIGPATDLWALGALLFRAVQGHAPYPEESTFELVQLVCAEPPAFAEECGPLRPVVESLLRQDPTERLDFEELNGWLRSLVRSAPEPEAGANVVPAPPFDAKRLPVVRRRGDLVRRKKRRAPEKRRSPEKRRKPEKQRAASASAPAADPAPNRQNGRHRHKQPKQLKQQKRVRETGFSASAPAAAPRRSSPPRQSGTGQPRSLGRLMLLLILVGLVAAVAYAVAFMPKSGENEGSERAGSVGDPGTSQGPEPGSSSSARPSEDGKSDRPSDKPEKSPDAEKPRTSGPELPQGFTLRKDAEGFRVAVASGWDRQPKNGRGQVLYTHGDFELIVVPGRDGTDEYGKDPMKYQREHERELQPFRDSTWATSSGMRTVEVGGRTMAEGQFTWQDTEGRETFVRNLAMAVGGKYHVVQIRGPEAERDEVSRLFEQASATYQAD
ncbi:protein kinase [Streptomyces sp. NPDC046925]|uniref:protein kinase n=1 Tax=Streptomyces sp. NPDC046925 TaxID=3155375 RepID=UPI0033FBF52A